MIPVGTLVNERYQIVRPVGRGGMGTVYEATDLRLQARVALKEMLGGAQEGFARAFAREAQLLAGLRHPALPKVSDYFVNEQGSFLVMDFIVGADLATMLADSRQAFDVSLVALWADQLLDVVHYLHSQQPPIVHRDIKPQNLKLLPSGQLMLLDFGLAKHQPTGGPVTSAQTGTLLAYTQNFAPPEQMAGHAATPLSDIFAIGATLYTLLSGQLPVDAQHRLTQVTVLQHGDSLVPLPQLNPQVSPALWRVVERAMALDPAARWPSAAAMRQAFAAAAATNAGGANQTAIAANGTAAGTTGSGSGFFRRTAPPVTQDQPLRQPSLPAQPLPAFATGTGAPRTLSPILLIGGAAMLVLVLIIGGWLFWQNSGGNGDGTAAPGGIATRSAATSSAGTAQTGRTSVIAPPRNTPSDPQAQTATAAALVAEQTASAVSLATAQTATAEAAAAATRAAAPSATPRPPSATPVPPSATPVPPSATPVPPSATPVPPSATPVPPSNTPIPPSDTPVPPSITPSPVTGVTILPIFTIGPIITIGPILLPTPTPTRSLILPTIGIIRTIGPIIRP